MHGLILAGGSGTRLWPLSRSHYPKQFLTLGFEESFLQMTVRRNLQCIPAESLYIVTVRDFYHEVLRQVRGIDPLLEANVLVEPAPKNTGGAIAFVLRHLALQDDELVLIAPADHMISPVERYVECVKQAQERAQEGMLVLFGVRPNRPETGYGYFEAHEGKVLHFVEKPALKTAREYLQKGNYYWNAGMFVFSAGTFRNEAQLHCPELLSENDEAIPSISIDYALMEKSKNVAMVPLDLTWSDVGSWENVYELLDKDSADNVTRGEVVAVDTTRSLVYAESRLVSTIGVDNLMIVETDDVVLVADMERSQQVKAVVGSLKELGKKEVQEHRLVRRPWGSYTVLSEGKRHKIKRIFVEPLQKLSLQMHYHRSEHWVIVSGTARVTINGEQTVVHEGESIFVPKSAVHRVENPGKVPLEIIEVQVGEYLGEDDIVRLEDVYGRLKEDEAFHLLQQKP